MSSTDAHAVRPGTSDALTARSIDATVHPPLRRAQESAAALVPRVAQAAAPFTSPLFLGGVALALTFVLVARRMRYRPSAILVAALIVMTLSSFHPMELQFQPIPVAKGRTPTTLSQLASARAGRHVISGRDIYGNGPMVAEAPDPEETPEPVSVPEPPEPPDPMVDVDAPRWSPPAIVQHIPEMSREMMRSAERMMRDNEQIRAMMDELRERVRDEARRARWRRLAAKRHIRPDEIESFGMVTP
ncbi:MAG TPA: hypothetical protein VLJ83_01700 [Gemmatimonadaceae bacterium]|nr:hypothetical protein [Gemmatimonadaceae bacterium]